MNVQTFAITLYDDEIEQLRRVTEHFNSYAPEAAATPEEFAAVVMRQALIDRCARLDARAKIGGES